MSDPPSSPPQRSLEPHLAAFFAVTVPPLSSLIALRLDRERPFVHFYSLQSLLFGIAVLAGYGLMYLAAYSLRDQPKVGLPLVSLGGMAFVATWVVIWLMQLLATLNRREWEMPVFGAWARRLQTRFDRSS